MQTLEAIQIWPQTVLQEGGTGLAYIQCSSCLVRSLVITCDVLYSLIQGLNQMVGGIALQEGIGELFVDGESISIRVHQVG